MSVCLSLSLWIQRKCRENTRGKGIHRLEDSHRFESCTVILTKVIRDENKGYLVDSASAFLISKSITVSGWPLLRNMNTIYPYRNEHLLNI